MSETPQPPHEVRKQPQMFYIEKDLGGGTKVASPGWVEVSTRLVEGSDAITTLVALDGETVEISTPQLYALQDRLGNPVAPREPMPVNLEAFHDGEKLKSFVIDSGEVAVSQVVEAPQPANDKARALEFLDSILQENRSPRGHGNSIAGSIEGMVIRGEISADDPRTKQLQDLAGRLQRTRSMYGGTEYIKEARQIIDDIKKSK